jgi:hypothetical protein
MRIRCQERKREKKKVREKKEKIIENEKMK